MLNKNFKKAFVCQKEIFIEDQGYIIKDQCRSDINHAWGAIFPTNIYSKFSLSSKEMGFLNPNSPFFSERGGAV